MTRGLKYKLKLKEAHNSFTTVGSLGSNARVTLFTRAKCRAKFKVCEKQNKMAALGFSRKSLVLASFRTVSRVKQFFKATASFPKSFTIEKKHLQPALCYIQPGHFCESNGDLMDKKSLNDRNRKSAKSFKYRRNQLHNKKTSQTLRKEAKEGKTYETSVGLNLDTLVHQPSPTAYPEIEHFLKNISQNELHIQGYEKMVPPYSAKPNPETLSDMYDPTKLYTFVIFDTKTTCTGKQAELCQLSAIKESSLQIF